MKKILLILSLLLASTSFAGDFNRIEGDEARQLFESLDLMAPSGNVVIRAVALAEKWSAESHGLRLFSPDLSFSCTESLQRIAGKGLVDYFYCDSYETPDLIDWESPMQEGKSIYREI